jgi:hypothetical protein
MPCNNFLIYTGLDMYIHYPDGGVFICQMELPLHMY